MKLSLCFLNLRARTSWEKYILSSHFEDSSGYYFHLLLSRFLPEYVDVQTAFVIYVSFMFFSFLRRPTWPPSFKPFLALFYVFTEVFSHFFSIIFFSLLKLISIWVGDLTLLTLGPVCVCADTLVKILTELGRLLRGTYILFGYSSASSPLW